MYPQRFTGAKAGEKDVAELMLTAAVAETRVVLESIAVRDLLRRNSKLLAHPAPHRLQEGFAAPWMTAAAIGPEAGPKRLELAALVQQQPIVFVEKKHGKRAVTLPVAGVQRLFAVVSHFPVIGINENQRLPRTGDGMKPHALRCLFVVLQGQGDNPVCFSPFRGMTSFCRAVKEAPKKKKAAQ
jgi:hypothetical protein